MHGTASVREDITAAAIKACRAWSATPHIDGVIAPFAGSGTLAFEAAIGLLGIPPAVFQSEALVAPFPATPRASLRHIRKALLERAAAPDAAQQPFPIAAIEIDAAQAEHLRTNALGFADVLERSLGRRLGFQAHEGDVFEWTAGPEWQRRRAFVAMNPPYGLRLSSSAEARRIYARLPRFLLNDLAPRTAGLEGFVFVPDERLANKLVQALRPWATDIRPFKHGGLTIYCLMFCELR
jgi:23S rRNA G2445 N2-methylase RlmL